MITLGLAGTIYFMADVLNPTDARLPAFEWGWKGEWLKMTSKSHVAEVLSNIIQQIFYLFLVVCSFFLDMNITNDLNICWFIVIR